MNNKIKKQFLIHTYFSSLLWILKNNLDLSINASWNFFRISSLVMNFHFSEKASFLTFHSIAWFLKVLEKSISMVSQSSLCCLWFFQQEIHIESWSSRCSCSFDHCRSVTWRRASCLEMINTSVHNEVNLENAKESEKLSMPKKNSLEKKLLRFSKKTQIKKIRKKFLSES